LLIHKPENIGDIASLEHAFALLARRLTAEQREQLDALLVIPSGGDTPKEAGVVTESSPRSGLEQCKALARKESPGVTTRKCQNCPVRENKSWTISGFEPEFAHD